MGNAIVRHTGQLTPCLSSRLILILRLDPPCLALAISTLQALQRQKCPHGKRTFSASNPQIMQNADFTFEL